MASTRPRRSRRAGPPPRISRWVVLRIYLVGGLVSLCLAAIAYNAYGVQVEQHERFANAADNQHSATIGVPAPRGVIHDRHGRELAITVDIKSIAATPRAVRDVTGTAEKLAAILRTDARLLEDKLSSNGHFAWIKRHVPEDLADRSARLNLPGIRFENEPRRYYPYGEVGSSVVGFSNIDGIGLTGVELTMNHVLEGKLEKVPAVRDAKGGLALEQRALEATPGASVVLTIDQSIQIFARRALEKAIASNNAIAGTALVLDVETSEVLAMANLPSTNPNQRSKRAVGRNHAIADAYEIGSVMKLFTIAAALDAGIVEPTTQINTEGGRYRIGRKTISDSHRDQSLDVSGVIMRSSNIGALKIARLVGAEALEAALRRFGFFQKTGIELPGERRGMIRDSRRWTAQDLASASYGYAYRVTPLQVAAGIAAIGNGGLYREPRIIEEVRGLRQPYNGQSSARRIMKSETASQLRAMMATVFRPGQHGGTAGNVRVSGYRAGGKTGTARKYVPGKGYKESRYVASFAGLAPIAAPKIAVVVVVDEPQGHFYGGQVAAPAFADIVSDTLRYLAVPTEAPDADADMAVINHYTPASKPGSDVASNNRAHLEPAPETPDSHPTGPVVPDFRGMSIAKALAYAHRHQIELSIEGSGIAIRQVPAPGTHVANGVNSIECRVIFDRKR